jgi:hypothetical protein
MSMPGFRAEESLFSATGYDRTSDHRGQAEGIVPALVFQFGTGTIGCYTFWIRQCEPGPKNTPPFCHLVPVIHCFPT